MKKSRWISGLVFILAGWVLADDRKEEPNFEFSGYPRYVIEVDYSKSYKDLVTEKYFKQYLFHLVTEQNFPFKNSKEKKKIAVEVFKFGRSMTCEQALTELKKMGLRPIDFQELIAFAYSVKDSKLYSVVALGSSCKGMLVANTDFFPYFGFYVSEKDKVHRLLSAVDSKVGLDADWFFAGVKIEK